MEMLAAQAAHRDGSASEDEEAVASNAKLSDSEKKEVLQKALNMAASNGDVDRIERILGGKAKEYVDVDAPDEEGTAPLIYASCFVRVPCECGGEDWANVYGNRAMTRLLRRCLRLGPMWISRIGIAGVRSCGL